MSTNESILIYNLALWLIHGTIDNHMCACLVAIGCKINDNIV